MGRAFDGWKVKEVIAPELPNFKQHKVEPKKKQKYQEVKKSQQK